MAQTSHDSNQDEQKPRIKTLKVAGGSETSKVAGAIASNYDSGHGVELIAIGAGAVNQAVKAIVIARGMVAPKGINLACIPSMVDVVVDGTKKTAMRFTLIG